TRRFPRDDVTNLPPSGTWCGDRTTDAPSDRIYHISRYLRILARPASGGVRGDCAGRPRCLAGPPASHRNASETDDLGGVPPIRLAGTPTEPPTSGRSRPGSPSLAACIIDLTSRIIPCRDHSSGCPWNGRSSHRRGGSGAGEEQPEWSLHRRVRPWRIAHC